MEVPFTRPFFKGNEGAAVAEAIASGWVSQGPRVRAFEQAFAARVGAPDAVATTNCTAALQLALYVSGVGPGDEVVVPSLSFIATANAVWQNGATPVFADVDPRTGNIDASTIDAVLSDRTKAVMPVHQLGLPADMDPILELARDRGLVVVEDAACAIGARYRQRPIGSLGPLACFSLHPRKVITTGEGGMIAVHDSEVAERLRRLRQHAMDVSDVARHAARDVVIENYPERGWNLRMTDMQAALGLSQLELLDEILAERQRQAKRYNVAFRNHPYVTVPYEPDYAERTWQSYSVHLSAQAPVTRNELMRNLLHDGIATRRGVMAIHREQAYIEAERLLPNTDMLTRESVMLPLFPGLADEQQDYVIERVYAHVAALAA